MAKFLAIAGFAGLLLAAQPALAAPCCDQATHQHAKACCDMPCCQDKAKVEVAKSEPTIIDYLFASGFTPVEPLTPPPPARQETMVWFKNPVLVGTNILQGQYIIQHDNDRMARGEPCTHIYAFNQRAKPVVAFHCTHLERTESKTPIAVLIRKGDMVELTEFQFAGETASHGVPSIR